MRVSVKELLRKFSQLSDRALTEPVIITKNGRDRLVLVSVEEYNLMRDMIESPPSGGAKSGHDEGSEVAEAKERPKRA
jgi:prevent-host-death family protein